MKQKYIITQIPPESADLAFFFDGDTFTERAGGIEYALFPLVADRWTMHPVINRELWEEITRTAEHIAEDFEGIRNDGEARNTYSQTYKEAMQDYSIKYNPTKCHRLKEWSTRHEYDPSTPEAIAEYLSITTGHEWKTKSATGYCQGDYAITVYCPDGNSAETAEAAGEIALGAASEYSVTYLSEDGSETDTVYGYIVADCQGWNAEKAKTLVCEWAGIDPAEAVLMIPGNPKTVTTYEYREVC
jgi:hypothetical protein